MSPVAGRKGVARVSRQKDLPMQTEGGLCWPRTRACLKPASPTAHRQVRQAAVVHRRHGRHAAPLPAGGPQLAALLLGPGHRHHPGRRDGAGQDGADHRLPLLPVQGGAGRAGGRWGGRPARASAGSLTVLVSLSRATPRGPTWSARPCPPSSTGSASSRCGRPTSTWSPTRATRRAAP